MSPAMDKLVAEEVTRCEKWLASTTAIKTSPRMPLKKFVERCGALHAHLLDLWGDWQFQGPVAYIADSGLQLSLAQREHSQLIADLGQVITNTFDHPGNWLVDLCFFNKKVGTRITDYKVCAFKTIPTHLRDIGYNYDMTIEEGKMMLRIGRYSTTTRGGNMKEVIIEAPIRVGQRFAAAMTEAIEQIPEKYGPIRKAYERFLQRLGESVWSGKEKPTIATLTCRPSAFLKLGHYDGVDPQSCYKNSGQHDSSKLFLAADIPDSFVILTWRGGAGEDEKIRKQQDEGSKPHGRGWGIAVPERGTVVSNFYGLTKDNVYVAVLAAVEHGLRVNKPKEFGAKSIKIRDGQNQAFYTNADCTYLASDTSFHQKYVEHYLDEILNYSDKLGLYTRTGQGPVRPLPKLKRPSEWPYPEVDFSVIPEGSLFV
jgi:hypothetical protein